MEPSIALILRQKEYLETHFELWPMLLLSGSTIFTQTLLLPWFCSHLPKWFCSHLPKTYRYLTSHTDLEYTNWRFISFAVVLNYLAAAIVLIYLHSYTQPENGITRWTTIVWLCIPISIVWFVPYFVTIFFCVLAIAQRPPFFRKAPQAAILRALLLLLLTKLKTVTHPSQLTSELRHELTHRIALNQAT